MSKENICSICNKVVGKRNIRKHLSKFHSDCFVSKKELIFHSILIVSLLTESEALGIKKEFEKGNSVVDIKNKYKLSYKTAQKPFKYIRL